MCVICEYLLTLVTDCGLLLVLLPGDTSRYCRWRFLRDPLSPLPPVVWCALEDGE